jgi:hypothetical protein
MSYLLNISLSINIAERYIDDIFFTSNQTIGINQMLDEANHFHPKLN